MKNKANAKSRLNRLFSAALLAAFFTSPTWPTQGQGSYLYITNFTKNGNIQQNLIEQFPTNLWVATNSLATPFDILTNSSGYNFYATSSGPLSVDVLIPGATTVYTMMNAYSPGGGTVATVEFQGDAGASQTFSLTGGVGIRDFFQGSFVNTINGTTTVNAFEAFNVQGAAGTGNVNTGLTGNYVIDEQVFALDASFLTQNLTNVTVAGNGDGTPIILGITALSVAAYITGVTQSVTTNLTISAIGGVAGRRI